MCELRAMRCSLILGGAGPRYVCRLGGQDMGGSDGSLKAF